LLLFQQFGGHVMVCGHQPLSQAARLASLRYPIILKYELGGDQDGIYNDQFYTGAVGDESYGYRDACVNVLDIAYFAGYGQIRAAGSGGCPVNRLRDNSAKTEGLREALPLDPQFPRLELRTEVSSPGRAYWENYKGLATELYNPPYFEFCTPSELMFPRQCFQPIYGHGCLDESSPLYNAPVAFWSGTYADVVPDTPRGVAARSVYLGFEPFYFNPNQVKEMMDIILFDEWQLPRLN
jgi:hypothetical protein